LEEASTKSQPFRQRFFWRAFRDPKGQGVVEYILLIVVILAIALIIMERLFKPMNKWAKNYIGDYIYCLLDQGELPSLGGTETTRDCDQGFDSFTAENGRPSKSSSSGSGSSDATKNRSGSNGSTAGGGISSRTQGGRSKSALGSGFDNGAGARGKGATSFDAGSGDSSRRRGGRYGGEGIYYSPKERGKAGSYNSILGILEREQEKIKKREEKVTAVGRLDKNSEGGSALAKSKKSFPYEPPKPKKVDDDIGQLDWSFGESFRSLLIIVILIVLALFIIGQLAQMSKSMEKE
jgi:hypothetical protein